MNFGFGEHTRLACAAWRLARQFPSEENRRAADFGTRAACAPLPQSIFCGMAVEITVEIMNKNNRILPIFLLIY